MIVEISLVEINKVVRVYNEFFASAGDSSDLCFEKVRDIGVTSKAFYLNAHKKVLISII